MKECFVITSYCNTQDRVEELIKCINNLKNFNIDILIHAHYPLDLQVQKLATFYIYDSTNPIIRDGSKSIIRWKWYKTANKLLTIPNPDYSYAVMNQWVESLKFLKAKNYEKIHIINYDTFISDFVFRKHQNFLDEYDAVFEYTNMKPRDFSANQVSDENLIFIVFFSIKKSFVDVFTNELTLEKYLASRDTMLETYIMEVIKKIEERGNQKNISIGLNSYKIKKFDDSQFKLHLGDAVTKNSIEKKEDNDVYTTISEANGFDLIKKKYKDEFGNEHDWFFIFGGSNHEHNRFEILFFEITKPINKIVISIKDETITAFNITEKYHSILTNFTINEITRIIDNKQLSISINDEPVQDNIINVMKFQNIQPKFD